MNDAIRGVRRRLISDSTASKNGRHGDPAGIPFLEPSGWGRFLRTTNSGGGSEANLREVLCTATGKISEIGTKCPGLGAFFDAARCTSAPTSVNAACGMSSRPSK